MIRHGLLSRTRQGSGPGVGHGPLTLVPMIDILTILVVYLLVHAADAELLSNPRNVAMPLSVSDQKPRATTVVTITPDSVYVNGEAIVALAAVRAAGPPVVEPLRAALAREGAGRPAAEDAAREVTVMAGKSLPYPVLRRIIASAAAAEYTKVSLAVIEREQAFAGLPGA